MKVILFFSTVLVIFALIFPVAAAWNSVPAVTGPDAAAPAGDTDGGTEGGLFYIPPERTASAKDANTEISLPAGWITDPLLTSSGRISSVLIGGAPVTGAELRSLFGLRSTAIEFSATDSSVTMTSTGYGHGVGMSQYGAQTMALEGADYREILANYYPGTELKAYGS